MTTWNDRLDVGELSSLGCEVIVEGPALDAASTDWGHVVEARPRAVVRPASTADVTDVLRFAATRGVPVAARGAGHSPFGQAQSAGGIVLDMTSRCDVDAIDGVHVTVDAGATWREVLAETLPRGLTPPVLTDYLDLTLGGTLSLGGLGGASQHHGAQTDTVAAMEVVTGSGEVITCSAEQDGELFDAVRGGLGQCGVITRVTVRLVSAKPRARRWIADCGSLGALVAEQRALVGSGRFDYLEGQIVRDPETGQWQHLLESAAYYSASAGSPEQPDGVGDLVELQDTSYLEFLDRLSNGVALLRAAGSWFHPHPWLNLFVSDEAVEGFVASTLDGTDPADLGQSGLILLYPLRVGLLRTPMLRLPAGETVWLLAILRTGVPNDPDHTERILRLNAILYRHARSAGGCVYPSSAVPMTAADWQAHFGPEWVRFTSAKERFDPAGILAPGQAVFARC